METSKFLPSTVHTKRENLCLNEKVSCKPFTFVPEVSNYSRGIFFRKVRSSYSLLSVFSEGLFVLMKKFPVNH